MPSSNISLIKRVESGHVLTAADMAALKTPPPGSARSRSQLSGNGSHGTMGSLHGPRSMNAIQAEGYSQRIDVERHTLAAQARLPPSASLLKFVADATRSSTSAVTTRRGRSSRATSRAAS